MAHIINRICPYCGEKMVWDSYKVGEGKGIQSIAYCDNDDCLVKPCTDSTIPSRVYMLLYVSLPSNLFFITCNS